MKVLFVCSANTCRSPMLEQMFRAYAFARDRKDIEVDSAGLVDTSTSQPDTLNPMCAFVLEKHGVPYFIDRVAKTCDKNAVKSADLIYTMNDEQADYVANKLGGKKKVKSLSAFCGQPIADPYGMSEEVYENTYALFNGILGKLFAEVTSAKKALNGYVRK